MSQRVMAAAATATHHHLELQIAATMVSGTLDRKKPKATNFPNDESGRIFATGGKNIAAQ